MGQRGQLHGLPVDIPSTWQNHTVYRFVDAKEDVGAGMMTVNKVRPLHDNVLVTQHAVPAEVALEGFLDQARQQEEKGELPSKVTAKGRGTCSDRPCAWEEVEREVPGAGMAVLQRRIAARGHHDGLVTLVVITAKKEGLDAMSEAFFFAKASP
jgi:co-chaperonin GroES (HSP10)